MRQETNTSRSVISLGDAFIDLIFEEYIYCYIYIYIYKIGAQRRKAAVV